MESWSGLNRVIGPSLCPKKYWYVVTPKLCGIRPVDFAKRDIFRQFPSEIQCVRTDDLRSITNKLINKQPRTYVTTSFGLCADLLRSRDIPQDGFISSSIFMEVLETVNGLQLELLNTKNFGAKIVDEVSLHHVHEACTPDPKVSVLQLKSQIKALNTNLEECKAKLLELEIDLRSRSSTVRSSSCESSPSVSPNSSTSSIEKAKSSPLGSTTKKRKVASICKRVLADIQLMCQKHGETLGCVLANGFAYGGDDEKDHIRYTISYAIDEAMKNAQPRKAGLSNILSSETLQSIHDSMRVPDWMLLYFKLHTRLPDSAWQTMLNLTHLGRSGKNIDTPVFLTKNEIKASKKLVFNKVNKIFMIEKLETDFLASGVDLESVLVWAIREHHLISHDSPSMELEFNVKIDGRPLGGRNQVAIGIVPINFSSLKYSSESALSVYPIAIGNCKENRENLRQLISNLNQQKEKIKREGLTVDGKTYTLKFTVTLDYKALLLLLTKKEDDKFKLGGKGFNTEFCAFCDAIRACTSHGADADETCLDCLRSKANIGRATGLRDDLICLLEEDLSHINLCSLHLEMRNTEQLLGSVGLFSYRIGCLDLLNKSLSEFGPEVSKDFSRITIKEKPGQQTAIEKHNIQVASCSGGTERAILRNIEEIVRTSLPVDKVAAYYESCKNSSEQIILDFITFFEERRMFVKDILGKGSYLRDYGTKQELINLDEAQELKSHLCELEEHWTSKRDELSKKLVQAHGEKEPKKKRRKKDTAKEKSDEGKIACLAAELEVDFFVKVCKDWTELALTMREEVFGPEDEQLIDIHDIKCKEWGYLLIKLFGFHLGTGDYGHLTIDHSAMLLRQFRSMYHYSGQGFESSHKLHRQLFAKATNHDSSGPGQSLDQILTHWYATQMLSLRYLFRQAKESIQAGKNKFLFRGCGWKANQALSWPNESPLPWILKIDHLFTTMFGEDFLKYHYNKDKGTSVSDSIVQSLQEYDHGTWEKDISLSVTPTPSSTPIVKKKSSPGTKSSIQAPTQSIQPTQPIQPTEPPSQPAKPEIITIQSPAAKTTVQTSSFQPVNLAIALTSANTRSDIAALQSLLPPIQFTSPTIFAYKQTTRYICRKGYRAATRASPPWCRNWKLWKIYRRWHFSFKPFH